MAKIKVRIMSPAARARFGAKHAADVVEVQESRIQMYLDVGVAIRADAKKPAKRRATKKAKVETATDD